MATKKEKVAVIGLGAYGLVTLKNLLEVGLDVVGFERNQYFGGLWRATEESGQTSVLPSTIANISKQRNSFTDFPFSEDVPNHPSSAQVQEYLEKYAEHFNLAPHIRLGVTVISIKRAKKTSKWLVVTESPATGSMEEEFDRLVVTTGTFHSAIMPRIAGAEHFKGTLIHSQSFKSTDDFKDKNVIVVGLSNSGADTAVELSKVAKKVYISHRSGARILPRLVQGNKPADHLATRRLEGIAAMLESISPTLTNKMVERVIEQEMHKTYPNLDPAWNLFPAPPVTHGPPIVNDFVIDLLASGKITSLPGISNIDPSGDVKMTDGSLLQEIDAIICCTGYRVDYKIISPEIDPTHGPTPKYDAAPYGSSVRRHARLYQGIFSPAYPDSLAFIGPYLIISAFTGADIVSQAIAQIFVGNFAVPPKAEIEKWCDDHYAWCVKQAHVARSPLGKVRDKEVARWLDQVCGNGMEKLGWGFEGWKFWWRERELYDLLVNGINTGFAYRLFEGRRKRWEGAKEAIYRANGRNWVGDGVV